MGIRRKHRANSVKNTRKRGRKWQWMKTKEQRLRDARTALKKDDERRLREYCEREEFERKLKG